MAPSVMPSAAVVFQGEVLCHLSVEFVCQVRVIGNVGFSADSMN